MEYIDKQRKDYLSWDEFFMGVAILASERSKDPNTQVGACIVSADNRILSVGYNGTPNGYEDRFFPWDREGDNKNETKIIKYIKKYWSTNINAPMAISNIYYIQCRYK
jgi:deoxycytidylate deaminase